MFRRRAADGNATRSNLASGALPVLVSWVVPPANSNAAARRGSLCSPISHGCGSSEGTLCGLRNGVVGVAGLVDALLFLGEVVTPVGVEVVVAVECPQFEDCFGAV